jgi:two-component system CheB/CheR fusion protein
MPELLQRATKLSVVEAGDRMPLKANTVYVAPSNKYLSIIDGALFLVDPPEPRGLRLPIDYFFRALADERHDRAIAIILSGMGSDGTLGVAAIKEHAGLVLVQDPASAKFDGMPRSAIDSGLADIVAAPEELPNRIAAYVQHIPQVPLKGAAPGAGASPGTALEQVLTLLREHTGHDFSLYKKTTVGRRIERRMGIHQLERMSAYVAFLKENRQEIDLLFKELLIGVTSFFRDGEAWNALQQQALLPMLSALPPTPRVLRAWVPGCSTGEEAYSLAIAFREAMDKLQTPARISLQIFATDLDPDAVQRARQALYPTNIAADLTPQRLARYFAEESGRYRVAKEIREMVVFAPQNVIMDPPFTKLDVLCCRNLLIYLSAELQKRLLPLFHYSLSPGGVLFLGSAETVGPFSDLFETIDGKARLFRRSGLASAAVEFPSRYHIAAAPQADAANRVPDAINVKSLVEEVLLQDFAPAGVLVNGEGDILYISGRTGRYLEPAAGKANWNVHAMARDGLRDELALALPKAMREHKRVVQRNLLVGEGHYIDLTLQPVDAPGLTGGVLIAFADVAAGANEARGSGRRAGGSAARVAEFERALQQAREETQAAREEMQTSREELKSTNEELQSTNEELQSTNEELTTSKEEMQSLNEELQTVNAELQAKVDELSAANNDMKNLLNSTDLATVFLDNALCIRRFTSQATRIFKLIPGDIGRPLSDIVSSLERSSLEEDGREVLRTLVFSEKEVATNDGRWFMVKIMPYRTLSNVIDGLVITFSDISFAKNLEAKVRSGEAR